MNRKVIRTFIFVAVLGIVLFALERQKSSAPDPVVIQSPTVLRKMTMDEKIEESDLIVLGQVKETLPSRWNTLEDINIQKIGSQEIVNKGLGIFTDSVLEKGLVLKQTINIDSTLRVRSFQGKIEHIEFVGFSEPTFIIGKTYLMFLKKDFGATKEIDPGGFIPVNAADGVYVIEGNLAVSSDDEWKTDDLIEYIRSSPLSLPSTEIPQSQENTEIFRLVESAFDIESKAAYDFNTERFADVFANSPLVMLLGNKNEFIGNFNPAANSVRYGYLDYKIAYYKWWQESSSFFEALDIKALSENRKVSQEEIKELIDSEWSQEWGLAPARAASPERRTVLRFVALDKKDEIVTVYLHDGLKLHILYLTQIDGRWFIVGDKENALIEN